MAVVKRGVPEIPKGKTEVVDDMFTTPGDVDNGEIVRIGDIEGSLVVIRPDTGGTVVIDTSIGESTALPADILVVDGEGAAPEWQRIFLFGAVLRRQGEAAARTGRPLVGVIGKGTAKSGRSAPWVVEEPSPAQLAAAKAAYLKTAIPF